MATLTRCAGCEQGFQREQMKEIRAKRIHGFAPVLLCPNCYKVIYNFMRVLQDYKPQQIIFSDKT